MGVLDAKHKNGIAYRSYGEDVRNGEWRHRKRVGGLGAIGQEDRGSSTWDTGVAVMLQQSGFRSAKNRGGKEGLNEGDASRKNNRDSREPSFRWTVEKIGNSNFLRWWSLRTKKVLNLRWENEYNEIPTKERYIRNWSEHTYKSNNFMM